MAPDTKDITALADRLMGHAACDPATVTTLCEAVKALEVERDRLAACLANLLAACEQANDAAIQQLGGVVIDFGAIASAQRALTGEVSFCGGYQNVLRPLMPQAHQLDWGPNANG